MSLTVWELLAVVALPLLPGAAMLQALGVRWSLDRLAYLAWSYLFGAFATAVVIAVLVSLSVQPPGWVVSLILVGLSLALWWAARRSSAVAIDSAAEPASMTSGTTWTRAFFALSVAVGLGVTVLRGHQPDRDTALVARSDGAFIYAAKAKVLWQAGGLNREFGEQARGLQRPPAWGEKFKQVVALLARSEQGRGMTEAELRAAAGGARFRLDPHLDYPMFNPLLQLHAYWHAGGIVHWQNRLPIQLFLLALVMLLAAVVRRRAGPLLGGVAVWLMVTMAPVPLLTRTALADAMVALGLLAMMDAWLRLQDQARHAAPWWRLFWLAAACTAFSKNEGVLYVVIWFGLLLGSRPWPGIQRRHLVWLLAPAAVIVFGVLVNSTFGFQNDMLTGGGDESPWATLWSRFADRVGVTLEFFASQVWFGSELHWLPGLLAVLCLAGPRRVFGEAALVPLLFLGISSLAHFGMYLATHHQIDWHLQTSAVRVSWQVWVCGLALACMGLRQVSLSRPTASSSGSRPG